MFDNDTGPGRERERHRMVQQQLIARGVRDIRVLDAMRRVPRHRFVPAAMAHHAYQDSPLPIGHQQTISQPYIVAYMTEQLQLEATDQVLDVGTGCGYQTAVLAELAERVCTIEIVAELAHKAQSLLKDLGYRNIVFRHGDGGWGWPEEGPFQAIIASACPAAVPPPLLEQLSDGGRLVMPVGKERQQLIKVVRSGEEFSWEELLAVRFVPLTGEWI